MTASTAHGTLYDDWLARRARLREYHGEREPIVAVQLRVLDYLIERYRDDAAALQPAPPTLDAVYLNQRAIVINHHRSFGLVAGVKSQDEASNRVAALIARMYGPEDAPHQEIHLDSPAVADDPWFGWSEPERRAVEAYWSPELTRLRWLGSTNEQSIHARIGGMPYLPVRIIDRLYEDVAALDEEDEYAAKILARCRNRVVVSYVARAWRIRVAAQKSGEVTNLLRQILVAWGHRAADNVRCLLADETAAVRMAAAELLADVGELRDIGIIADLLAMPTLPDEEPAERFVLAGAMENLAKRLDEERLTAD